MPASESAVMRHTYQIEIPKACAAVAPSAPLYDVFFLPPYHLAIVGPWYSRVVLGLLAPKVNGEESLFWQVPDPRMFTFTAKIEIPRRLRDRPDWEVTLGISGQPPCRIERPAIEPSGQLAIMTLAKFDAPYVGEWLEYHRALGVQHVYLYNNGSPELHAALAPYGDFVTEIDWPYRYGMYDASLEPFWKPDSHMWTQPPAMVHAALRFGQAWDWMAFIDADEFLVPLQHDNLLEVLRDAGRRRWVEEMFQRPAALQVAGKWFGTSGHPRLPPGSVVENYRRCEVHCTSPLKSIVRPDAVVASAVHWWTVEGETMRLPESVLRFNHYRAISDHQNRRGAAYDREFTNAIQDEGRAVQLATRHGLLKPKGTT